MSDWSSVILGGSLRVARSHWCHCAGLSVSRPLSEEGGGGREGTSEFVVYEVTLHVLVVYDSSGTTTDETVFEFPVGVSLQVLPFMSSAKRRGGECAVRAKPTNICRRQGRL